MPVLHSYRDSQLLSATDLFNYVWIFSKSIDCFLYEGNTGI